MLNQHFGGRVFLGFAMAVVCLAPLVAFAGHGDNCCPECGNAVCVPSFATVKEKKHTWEVDCKPICVPHIRWPWQPCCEPPKCGYVKNVKVLKKVEYECEKCGCKWDVKCLDCCETGACR